MEIWSGVTDAFRTDSLTTLKDSATQLLIKYKSGALVTRCKKIGLGIQPGICVSMYVLFASSSRTSWIDAKELLWFADLLEMADWFTALKLGSGRGLAWYVSAVP